MSRFGRIAGLVVLAGALLAGCAQPGQLGSPVPPPAAAPPQAPDPAVAPAAVPVVAGTAQIASGTVQDRVRVTTQGPARFTVQTVLLEPGESTGWHRHPGTETSIVNSGSVTVQREGVCTPERYGPGDAVFVGDAVPHVMRNDGTEPAQLVVTQLLAPGEPDRVSVDAACPPAAQR